MLSHVASLYLVPSDSCEAAITTGKLNLINITNNIYQN